VNRVITLRKMTAFKFYQKRKRKRRRERNAKTEDEYVEIYLYSGSTKQCTTCVPFISVHVTGGYGI
jgi:hypothetical protein